MKKSTNIVLGLKSRDSVKPRTKSDWRKAGSRAGKALDNLNK